MNPFVLDQLKPILQNRRILLGITGSIAAFKSCDLIRFLRQAGAQVRVVMTESAQRFVTPLTQETLSGTPVNGGPDPTGTHHIEMARWAELAIIAPASANTLAKLAHGLADDLLSTELLAFRGPLILAPAMNPTMYEHPAVQANIETLRNRGVILAGPTHGATACGETGLGRMLEPEALLETIAHALIDIQERPTRASRAPAKRMLITLGPTRSAIDPVRYITNRSSGLMGASLAWAAWRAGYELTVIAGPVQVPLPEKAQVFRVLTAHEMLERAQSEFPNCEVFVSTAAVLDWDVRSPASHKLKKHGQPLSLEFEENPDILATLAADKRSHQFVLGFAAETQDVVAAGTQKRIKKHCDALFANDVSLDRQGFESPLNGGWWIDADQVLEVSARPKPELANFLIHLIQAKEQKRALL
ncbi:bifunctional phosphopantothenoylcysteine decarboxylase/phosphopantothenate--cysteine ligase CoaBC [Bdellovibrionota bacterium FG-1]